MLKHINTVLARSVEVVIGGWGQSPSRPWGTQAEGFGEAPHLQAEPNGVDLAITAGFIGTVGTGRVLTLSSGTLDADQWIGAEIRLGVQTLPKSGYGIVTANTTTTLTVTWVYAADNTATSGYVCFADDRFKTYPAVRVLMPYQPDGTGPVPVVVTFTNGTDVVNWVAHGLAVGTPVVLAGGTGSTVPTGLTFGVVYYVTVTTANTFKLATTVANAVAGTFVDFTTDGVGPITATPRLNVSNPLPVKVVTFLNSTDRVNWAAHGHIVGTPIVLSGGTGAIAPTGLAFGTVYYVTSPTTNDFRLAINVANAIAGTQIDFTSDGSGTITASVLPLPPGDGYNVPAGVTSYENYGLFLPFTFLEGIDSHGVSESSDSYSSPTTHPPTGATATTFSFLNASPAADIFAGGFVVVRHAGGISWADISTNPAGDTLSLPQGWRGAGLPQGTPATWKFEAWVPHYNNSPHAKLIGFRYPSNDFQPGGWWSIGVFGGAARGYLRNRTRGVTTTAYQPTHFGPVLPFGFRVQMSIGQRINLVWLGINSASIVTFPQNNEFTIQAGPGSEQSWLDDDYAVSWSPALPRSIYTRYITMWRMVPTALLAESNTNPAKVIGIVGMQGQGDALLAEGRATYKHSLPNFYTKLRRDIAAITSQGESLTSLLPAGTKLPFVHDKIIHVPYELSGTFTYYGITFQLSGDSEGKVNTAIVDTCARDGFATHGVPYNADGTQFSTLLLDPLHFDGVGEVRDAHQLADKLLPIVNDVFSMRLGADAVNVCNMALAYLGDTARVTSIDPVDGSAQAAHCAKYFMPSWKTILAAHNWAFASRRLTLTEITNDSPQYSYAYGLPFDVLRVTAVLDKDAADDHYSANTSNQDFRLGPTGTTEQPFREEQDREGNRVLRTHQANAAVRYTSIVTDFASYPPNVINALAMQLAAWVAGPIIGGDVGTQKSRQAMAMMTAYLAMAKEEDSRTSYDRVPHLPSFLAGR